MCGINGIFAYGSASGPVDREELVRTRDYMFARGPDGKGAWVSADGRVGFGHRRLAIIDLTDAGGQPMSNADGTLVVTFNGEIYNYKELRSDLEAKGHKFRSHSDTEVLLHLYADKGERMMQDLRGMFAFAIWDERRRELFLARDPYGVKPLYYSNNGSTFRFASQVKALLAGGGISSELDPAGVTGFNLWGSVPEPFTIYRNVSALPAGSVLTVKTAQVGAPVAFASISAVFADAAREAPPVSQLPARLRAAALDSVRAHIVADVEVGLFLSAGVDSGALLGLMRDAGQNKTHAITLAFEEFQGSGEDEAPLAAKIAKLYGGAHTVRRISQAEFFADLPSILDAMDQPSIDGVNAWLASKAAREAGLKVALSGVGGDELLAGYPSFRQIPLWAKWLRAPAAVPGLGIAARWIAGLFGLGRRSPKLAGMLEYGGTYPGAYLLRRGLFLPYDLKTVMDPDLAQQGLAQLRTLDRLRLAALTPDPGAPLSRVAAMESVWYLRNQLLRDSDWAGMAHSVEIRTPLVDYWLLKAVAPFVPALTSLAGKAALAAAPTLPLPASIVARRKSGFGVPIGRWHDRRDPRAAQNKGSASRAWAQEVLSQTVESEALRLAAAPVRQRRRRP